MRPQTPMTITCYPSRAIASGGLANYLVTGEKRDLLALRKHEGTAIVTVSQFLTLRRR